MINRRLAILTFTLLSFLMISAGVLASSTATIDRWALSSGGGSTAGETVTLDATQGQPIVGTSSGDSISLVAGFWSGAGEVTCDLYLPQVSR